MTDPRPSTAMSTGLAGGWPRFVLPVATLGLTILAWDLVVRINHIPPFILPGPGLVAATLVSDWTLLWDSLLVTLTTTFEGLALALFGGIGLAILFNQSRLIEHSLYPFAVILQVTPVVAIAPLAAHLPAAAGSGARLRLDRGVLSGAGQHHAGDSIRSIAIWWICSRSTEPPAPPSCGG